MGLIAICPIADLFLTTAEAISIGALAAASAPKWLKQSCETAKWVGLDRISIEEIDAEIDAARKARRNLTE
jgi:hypothetical protein